MNYSEICIRTGQILAREDLVDVVGMLVEQGESGFVTRVRSRLNWTAADFNFSAAVSTYDLPSDFLSWMDAGGKVVGYLSWPGRILTLMPHEAIAALPASTGTPAICSVKGTKITVWPAPDQSSTGTLAYFNRPPSIKNNENALAVNEPAGYIYAALCEAELYLMNDPRVAVWKQKLEEAIVRINTVWAVEPQGT